MCARDRDAQLGVRARSQQRQQSAAQISLNFGIIKNASFAAGRSGYSRRGAVQFIRPRRFPTRASGRPRRTGRPGTRTRSCWPASVTRNSSRGCRGEDGGSREKMRTAARNAAVPRSDGCGSVSARGL